MPAPEELRGNPVQTTPFYSAHSDLGARFMRVGDWIRPAEYGDGWQRENLTTRGAGGIFDGHSMGRFELRGAGARDLLDRLSVRDVASLRPGRGRYLIMCNEAGGILDDPIVFCLGEEHYYLTASTWSRGPMSERLRAAAPEGVQITDVTTTTAYFAVQGPASRAALGPIVAADLSDPALPFFGCVQTTVAGVEALVCRAGYTGELGFEVNVPAEYALYAFWEVIRAGAEHGVVPCGTRALQSLRLEKAFPMYGLDISESTNPFEAGMTRFLGAGTADFVGREALARLAATAPRRRLVAVRSSGGTPLKAGGSLLLDDLPVGTLTSVDFGPSVGAHLGLAYLDIEVGSGADLRCGSTAVEASEDPFLDPAGKRLRS